MLWHRFDDMNTEKLRMAAREGGVERDLFYFDPEVINWDDYFLNIHLPGVVKYIFKWDYKWSEIYIYIYIERDIILLEWILLLYGKKNCTRWVRSRLC